MSQMPQAPPIQPKVFRFAGFELDVRAGELRKDDETIRLQEQCLQILLMLLAHPGEVITREELRARLWPHGTIVDFEQSVNAAIKRLRQALGESADNPKFVETIPRRGYRFLAKVEGEPALGAQETAGRQMRLNDRYELLDKLGAGGMGEVYRARDLRLEREVAVKVLPTGMVGDETARRRFRKEAVALSRLSHASIATVFDFDTDGTTDFLVMEYVPGATLTEKIAAGPLGQQELVELGTQLCDGLAAAHAQAIVHRDLKPDNVKISTDGRLKILDFGLAKLLAREGSGQDSVDATESSPFAGTLLYMAPEQWRGGALDARTDIWAAGVVLYEMATRRQPFAEVERSEVAGAILRQAPVPPSRLNSTLSPELDRIIGKCLEKQPDNRYQSAKELQADLRRVSLPTAVPSSLPRRLWWWKVLAAGVVVFAAFLAVATYYSYSVRKKQSALAAPQIRSLVVLPLENLTGDPEQAYLVDGIHEDLTATLARISALTVKSRTSAQHYRKTDKTVPVIARELGVDVIMEGSVRRSGKQVAITLQLIEAANDRHLWGNTYQRDLGDVYSMQSEIAMAVAREVNATLAPAEQSRLASARAVDPEVYELYQKGRHFMAQLTVESVPKAIWHFEQALLKNPDYAPAYAGLAELYLTSPGRQVSGLSDRQALAKAESAAMHAIQLDPNSAEAHIGLGRVRVATFRPHSAEREFRRALELNPNSADAHLGHAFALARLGRGQDAIVHGQRARDLDPVSPYTNWMVSAAYYWAGDPERAKEQIRRVLELDPNFPMAHYYLAMQHIFAGRYEAVNCDDPRMAMAGRNPERLAFLTFCYGKVGRLEDARAMFRRLHSDPNIAQIYPRMLAFAHLGIGDREQAIAVLQRAMQEPPPWFDEILFEPSELDSDPRYQAIKQAIRARYAEDQ